MRKKILLLLVLLVPTLAKASCNNEIPLSFAQEIVAAQDYTQLTPKQCKDFPEEQCLCFQGLNLAAIEIVDEIVDGAPIYTVNSQVGCTDESDCLAKQQALVCDAGFTSAYRLDTPQAYCYRLDGYEPVYTGKKKLQHNATKIAQVQAAESAKAALQAGLAQARRTRLCGEGIIDLLLVRNGSKSLTTAQVKQLVSTYASIMQLLQSGSLNSAKEEIQAVTPDGTIVTEADKVALVAEVNKCLGQ